MGQIKKVLFIFIILSQLNSCENSKTLITKNSVGMIKLGKIIDSDYDKSSLQITLNSDKKIETIIISNSKYKTKEGFGVDSKIEDIAKRFNVKVNEDFKASKGKIPIIDLGRMVVADSILFMDSNKDNLVDAILISSRD